MPRTWTRAWRDLGCGYCGRTMERGAPVLEIRLHTVRATLLRCPLCAGEPVPELPPLETPQRTAGDFSHVAAAAPHREWMPYRDVE